jgi:predicted ATP-grasp superfamily ATP-dependent carboligase
VRSVSSPGNGSTRLRVLVTDGNNRAALAVVRSLGRAGHWVAVGESRPGALAQASRYCAQFVTYPDPVVHEEQFVERLLQTIRELRIDVLVPITDITAIVTATHRAKFEPGCRLPLACANAISRAADKIAVLQRAQLLGVPTPKMEVASSSECEPGNLDYPVVLKPARSRVRTAAGWKGSAVSYATDHHSLRAQLDAYMPEQFPIALQEKISGPGIGVFMCFSSGKLIASFAHERIREKPPSGGVSVLCKSISMPSDAFEHAKTLLTDLRWEGVAMVEFKRDVRDGTAKLMEINGRFWGSLQLAIDAGVDFPRILIDSAVGQTPAAMPDYRVGVQSRWFWGDVDALLIQLFGAGSTARSIKGGRLTVLRDFLRMWSRDLYYENPKWDDPRPWLNETRHWLWGTP